MSSRGGGKTSTSASNSRLNTANIISDGEQMYKWSKMFDKLLPSGGLKMRINLPDTILVDSEQKILSWYHTTEGGYIASKSVQRVTLQEAVTEFCANMFEDTRVNPNLYVAVAYFADQRRVLLRRSDILSIVRQKAKKVRKENEREERAPEQPAKKYLGNADEPSSPSANEEENSQTQEADQATGDQTIQNESGNDEVVESNENVDANKAEVEKSEKDKEEEVEDDKEAREMKEEELKLKFRDFFSRAFMLQQYFPPSLDRRYVCRYSSDKVSGKVGFSIVARRYSDRYTNNLDVSVNQAVEGVSKTVSTLLTADVLPAPSMMAAENEGSDGKASSSKSSSPTKTKDEKKKYFKGDSSGEIPEHPRDLTFKSDVRKAVTTMVNFIERNHRVEVTSCVTEFVRGLEGRPWLLMLEGLPSSRNSRGSAQTRFNTAARESASRMNRRPRSASPMRKSAKFSSSTDAQVLKIHSRPSSARGSAGSRPLLSRSNRTAGTAKSSEAMTNFESSMVEALSQDIEILKEKIQQQNDMLEQTESALKRELERRKAHESASTNEIIKLKEETEMLKQDTRKLKIENEIYKEKSEALEKENFEITQLEDERQSGLKDRVSKLESIRNDLKDKCRSMQLENEQLQKQETSAISEKRILESRLAEEQETVAAVRAQLVSLRKKLLDTEAKNKELEFKVSTYHKGGKTKRRIIAPEDPSTLAMRAEQVVNNLNTHDLMVDYEPGYGDEKENQDVNRIRHKICDVLCNNVESLQDIYNYYAQLGEVYRQGHSLLMNQMQFLKFATDIDYFYGDEKQNGEEESLNNIDDIDIIFHRIVSKDDTHTKITFTGFLEGICRLAYAKYGSTLKILIVEEDNTAPEERQVRIDKQAEIVMNFLANLLRKARWNKLGGSSVNKQKAQWKKALEKSLRVQRTANILTKGMKSRNQ